MNLTPSPRSYRRNARETKRKQIPLIRRQDSISVRTLINLKLRRAKINCQLISIFHPTPLFLTSTVQTDTRHQTCTRTKTIKDVRVNFKDQSEAGEEQISGHLNPTPLKASKGGVARK